METNGGKEKEEVVESHRRCWRHEKRPLVFPKCTTKEGKGEMRIWLGKAGCGLEKRCKALLCLSSSSLSFFFFP